MKRLIYALLSIAVLTAMAATGWFYSQLTSMHAPPRPVQLMIPQGASALKIAQLLEHEGVIVSALAFRLKLRIDGNGGRMRSGLYRFEYPASMEQVMLRLQQGDVMHFLVTVPEGLRSDEVLLLLAEKTATPLPQWQAAFKQLLPAENEGRLLPETYRYSRPVQPLRLLKTMMDAQQKLLSSLTADATEQERLRIMASIIEKETMLAKERPLVAAVIRNRLRKGMPLQMDPTVIYGIWKTTGTFSGDIRKKDLTTDTPWSTYTRKGLPPTPIGNPGEASLRAAAAPADVPYLYFVADGSGGHRFASTLAEHSQNVARWMRIERGER